MNDCLKSSLRMRPDRIIVGEVRGPEAATLLTAMNTGHDGSFGSLHANTAQETDQNDQSTNVSPPDYADWIGPYHNPSKVTCQW